MTCAEVHEDVVIALNTLRSRKLRSGLTILGIVIGITSVITIAAITEGLNESIQDSVKQLGSSTLFVTRIPAGFNPFARLPEKIRRRKYLEYADATFLRDAAPSVEFATSFSNRINFGQTIDQIRYGNEHVEKFFLRGVEPDYTRAIPLFAVNQGRFISQYDYDHARSVI